MFGVLKIAPLALPVGAAGMLIGLAALIAGLVLLAFGRVAVWRIVSALILAAAGAALGSAIATTVDAKPGVLMIVAALLLAAVGAVLARLWWALLLGAVLASLMLLIVLHNVPVLPASKPPQGFADSLRFGVWLPKTADVVGQWISWLWKKYQLAELVGIALPGLVGVVTGLARPVATRILMTSVLGAAAAVMGGCILLQSARPGFDVAAGWRIWPLLAVAVLLAALGMVYQSRAQARRGKKSEQETEAAPPPPKSPSRR